MKRTGTAIGLVLAMTAAACAGATNSCDIPWVDSMPRIPQPLRIIDWKQTARDYYRLVFDPAAIGPNLPAVDVAADRTCFGFPAYLTPGRKPNPRGGEAITCLAGVVGAQLVGLDMKTYQGVDWAQACNHWFDSADGVYQDRIGQSGGIVSHVIYGYWPLALGVMLADANRDDPDYRRNIQQQFAFLLQMATDMGCPDRPDLKQGYDIAARKVTAIGIDWNPGNASCLAWMLYMGYQSTGNPEYLQCAEAALRWQLKNPGRYEVSHVMGPLVMARLNAEQRGQFDMAWMMDNWFGDYTRLPGFVHHWAITRGTKLGGMTCDGLDGAWWRKADDNGFYAFAMGSYQAPAWLVPVARYDQRFARSIARYALNAANSCRFFLGIDLDGDHQDHLDWRDSLPEGKGFLFSYEGFRTEAHHADAAHSFRPYATGDPLALFSRKYHSGNRAQYWIDKASFCRSSENISLYMGHHIGMLGAIFNATDVPGILAWDLTATDYFRPPCYPSFLLHNPYEQEKTIHWDVGPAPGDLYEAVAGMFIRRNVRGKQSLTLGAGQAMVLVLTPVAGKVMHDGTKLMVDGVVVDYRSTGAGGGLPGAGPPCQ
jgi:hypothetical protein